MNDPRSKVWGAIEALAKELPEHADALLEGKEALKAWGENEIRLKTEAISAREAKESELEAISTEFSTFKEEATKVIETKPEPSAELTEMQKKYEAMEARLNEADAKTEAAKKEKYLTEVKSTFLKGVNLKDEFAERDIDLLIARNQVSRAEDGSTEIIVGENKFTIESYGKHLEESNPGYLKTVTGGKQGNFTNEPAGDIDKTAKLKADVKAGTNGLVQFRN